MVRFLRAHESCRSSLVLSGCDWVPRLERALTGLAVVLGHRRHTGRCGPPLATHWGGISLARHHITAPQRRPAPHLEQPPIRAGPTAPGRCRRTLRLGKTGRSAPHPGAERPQPLRAEPQPAWITRMAARPLSSAAPATRTSITTGTQHGNHDEHRRAGCYGKRACPVREGAVEKGPITGISSAAYFMSRRDLGARGRDSPGRPTVLFSSAVIHCFHREPPPQPGYSDHAAARNTLWPRMRAATCELLSSPPSAGWASGADITRSSWALKHSRRASLTSGGLNILVGAW